ncbi:hypothetical protein [Massilia frigida]|nr:hypothetical protein [Massilia frigida]
MLSAALLAVLLTVLTPTLLGAGRAWCAEQQLDAYNKATEGEDSLREMVLRLHATRIR